VPISLKVQGVRQFATRTPELAVLGGIEEAFNHGAIISTIVVHCLNPVQVRDISQASKLSEVLHGDEGLVVVLLADFPALHQ
jgi:hypothetical protein